MLGFVAEAPGGDAFPLILHGVAIAVLGLHLDLHGALHNAVHTGQGQAALEALLLALLLTKSTTAQILKDAGLSEQALRQAIKELRGGQKAASQGSEDTYQALEKYILHVVL